MEQELEQRNDPPTKKELFLDAMGVVLLDVVMLAGIVSTAFHVQEDPLGCLAVMLLCAIWGCLYSVTVLREDARLLGQARKATA